MRPQTVMISMGKDPRLEKREDAEPRHTKLPRSKSWWNLALVAQNATRMGHPRFASAVRWVPAERQVPAASATVGVGMARERGAMGRRYGALRWLGMLALSRDHHADRPNLSHLITTRVRRPFSIARISLLSP